MKDFSCALYFDKRRADKDGLYPIFLRLYRQGKNTYINSGFSAYEDGFDGTKFVGESIKSQEMTNDLHELFDKFRLWCLDFDDKDMTNKTVKMYAEEYLRGSIEKRNIENYGNMTLVALAEEYINVGALSHGSKKAYSTYMRRIKEYDGRVTINDVTKGWLRSFETYMLKKGLRRNTIAGTMSYVYMAMNYGIDCEYTNNLVCNRYKKIKHETTPMRTLTLEQLRTIRDMRLEGIRAKARDIFMLSFYLLGINPKDLIFQKRIVNGRIHYCRAKTKKNYDIFIPEEAMEIINRYRGKEYLLDIMDGKNVLTYTNQTTRLYYNLRKIGEELGIYLTMYYARYTCATMLAELDFPMETVSQCLGHSTGAAITQVYVQFNKKKIDEAQRALLEYVKGNQ